MPRFLAALVALATLSNGCNASTNNGISVDVYYEQLCPYSIRFVTQQLVPAYEHLKDYVTINFVPFGKASYVTGHPTKFTCQHGPTECESNKRQACALHEIQQSVISEDQQKTSVDVVGCIMENSKEPTAAIQCAKKAGLAEKSILSIQSCSNSDAGDELLINCGKKTEAFQSPLEGVPTVVLNGVENLSANVHFIREVCALIVESDKPVICKQSPSE